MSEDNYRRQEHLSPQHHHVHYHYHYYYSETPMTDSRVSNYSHHQPIGSPRHPRNPQNGPEYRSFISSPKQWKAHVNPEINKMYREYRFNQSSLSQIKPQIFEENEDYETPSPIKSEVLKTVYQSNSQTSLKKVSRLDELYQLKKGTPAEQREEIKSQRTGVTSMTELSAELKLREYERQIQRLRRYEQECQYLRGRFYNHAVTRHPDEIEKS